MSQKRRSLPRKKPGRSASDEILDDLPILESADDLPELPLLEPVEEEDDGPVKVALTASDDAAFDDVLSIEVPAMEKAAVQAAVSPALAKAAQRHGAKLRWRRVLVRFGGEALIGSAIKQVVADALKDHKPATVVVRRGFGDETVHQQEAPKLAVEVKPSGDAVEVAVDTGTMEVADLAALLPAELAKLAAAASGKQFAFAFRGAAKADAAVRDLLATTLRGAGARRIAIGARVLFDQELVDAVTVRASDKGCVVTITPPSDPALLGEAIALYATERASELAGKAVRVWFAKDAPAGEIAAVVAMCRDAGATRFALGEDGHEDVVWPSLIGCEVGKEVVLKLDANGRSRSAVLRALARECPAHVDATRGKAVVIDWPAGFALDAEVVDGALAQAIAVLQPKRLSCTVAGEGREPFAPAPFAVGEAAGVRTLRVDLDAGKPADLMRAFERRLSAMQASWRGQSVRVVLAGDSAPSRSLVRGICGAVEAAGAMRLEVDDHGSIDLLLPAMLTVGKSGDAIKVSALAGDRNEAQQDAALARELEAAGIAKGATVRVVPSPLEAKVVAAVIKAGAGTVILDGAAPVRVHPAMLSCTGKGKTLTLSVTPSGDAAMDERQWRRELPAVLGGLAGKEVSVVWAQTELPSEFVAALVGGGVEVVLHDQGDGMAMQVHPPIEAIPVEPEPEVAPAAAAPAVATSAAPAAAVPPMPAMAGTAKQGLVSVLARHDRGVPPTAVLALAAGEGDEHAADVAASLAAMQAAFAGRAILLVLRKDGKDVPVRGNSTLVRAASGAVAATAAATMVFRGPDEQGRPHFTVVQSRLRGLRVGAAIGDPRRG